jgi:hypothetical protein
VAELKFYADDADRRYGRTSTRRYATVGEAVAAGDALAPPATVVDILGPTGASVPLAYRELMERTRDGDRVIHHRWDRDGWAPFRTAVVSADGAQVFTPSVNGRRGRVTSAVGSAAGNLRVVYLRDGTRWPDSEMKSLWWPPSIFSDAGAPVTNRPQMGHIHGAYVGDDGRLRGAAVWCNIFGGPNPEALLINNWESDGTTLWQGASTGNAGSSEAVGRTALVLHANRFVFGGTFTDLRVLPSYAAVGLVAGATGDLTGMAVTGLNQADASVQGGAPGGLIRLNASGSAVTDATAGGTWTPDYPWRVFPYWVRSKWEPPVMSVMQWAYGSPEPDWGDQYTWSATISVDADTAEVPGSSGVAGLQGFIFAHAHTGAWMEVGNPSFARAGALT